MSIKLHDGYRLNTIKTAYELQEFNKNFLEDIRSRSKNSALHILGRDCAYVLDNFKLFTKTEARYNIAAHFNLHDDKLPTFFDHKKRYS